MVLKNTKLNKNKPFLLLLTISLILITANFDGNTNNKIESGSTTNSNILNHPNVAGNHDPILIDGNDELAIFIDDEELSGEGTNVSPYIIENFIKNASTAHGIEIRNTNAFLIIRNCTVEGGSSSSYSGICLNNTTNVNISNNYLNYNLYGIYLNCSSNNTLSGNYANNNEYGIYLKALYINNNNTLSGNNANNNEFGIYLYHSSNNTLSGNNANNNEYGIYLGDSRYNIISENNVSNNYFGIFPEGSNKNSTLSRNNVHDNVYGIYLWYSMCTFSENTVNNNEFGIYVGYSDNNILSGNNVYNNYQGFHLIHSNNNALFKNYIHNNEIGIYVYWHSSKNTIYNNDICGNQYFQSFEEDYSYNNHWDNGTMGNFWGNDYIIKCPDATNDGSVWNTPYEIDGDLIGIDNFPLVNSIYPNFEPPQFTNIPEDFSANEGYKFLFIMWISIDLHPGTYSIKLDGTEVVSSTTWSSGTLIMYDIPDELLKGKYNITIIISDDIGNTAQDTVLFRVKIDETTNGIEIEIPGFPLVNILIFISVGIFILRREMNHKIIRN